MYPPFPGQRLDHHNLQQHNLQHPPMAQNFPGMPFAPPPGWFPPPGQAFPHQPRPFPGQNAPFHQALLQQQQQGSAPSGPALIPPIPAKKQEPPRKQEDQKPPAQSGQPVQKKPTPPAQSAPTPPVESKPTVTAALAPAKTPAAVGPSSAAQATKDGPNVPAVAVPNLSAKRTPATKESAQATTGNDAHSKKAQPSQTAANEALHNATLAATAAVAAAMARLPPASDANKTQQAKQQTAVEELTRKVNELKTNDGPRAPRHPGGGGHQNTPRGGRGRGGQHHQQTRKVEVPTTDYDFATANARFNKQDLVKEAIATGSPTNGSDDKPDTNGVSEPSDPIIPAPSSYNKAASFFDNISSEAKDREDTSAPRPGGREWRGEEQKKNFETFGQGSVDTGYRGGFRGRGRGRGYRGRGGQGPRGGNRGGGGGGRGRYRGDQNGQAGRAPPVAAST